MHGHSPNFLTNKIQNLSQIFSPFISCFLQILKHAKVSAEIYNQWRFKRSDPLIQKLFHPPQTHLKQQTAVPCHLMRKNDQNWFALKCKENTRIKHTSTASCYYWLWVNSFSFQTGVHLHPKATLATFLNRLSAQDRN